MDVAVNSFGIDACVRKQLTRRLRELQDCPFLQDAIGSPCSPTSACSSVDWSNPDPSEECETEILLYCRKGEIENDVTGCMEVLEIIIADCMFNALTPEEEEAFAKGVTQGRDGKGVVYLAASGNDFVVGDVNFEGYTNSRYTITVGAVGKFGAHASYSTSGAAVFVSPPGKNDFRIEVGKYSGL